MRKGFYLFLLLSFVFTGLQAQTNTKASRTEVKKDSHGNITYSTTGRENSLVKVELKDFPAFNSTGDIEKDNQNYKLAKDQWISQHPDEYNSLLESIKINKDIVYGMPGFPQYKDTGDSKADMANYRAAKSLWFKNNHDILSAMKNDKIKKMQNRQQNIKK